MTHLPRLSTLLLLLLPIYLHTTSFHSIYGDYEWLPSPPPSISLRRTLHSHVGFDITLVTAKQSHYTANDIAARMTSLSLLLPIRYSLSLFGDLTMLQDATYYALSEPHEIAGEPYHYELTGSGSTYRATLTPVFHLPKLSFGLGLTHYFGKLEERWLLDFDNLTDRADTFSTYISCWSPILLLTESHTPLHLRTLITNTELTLSLTFTRLPFVPRIRVNWYSPHYSISAGFTYHNSIIDLIYTHYGTVTSTTLKFAHPFNFNQFTLTPNLSLAYRTSHNIQEWGCIISVTFDGTERID